MATSLSSLSSTIPTSNLHINPTSQFNSLNALPTHFRTGNRTRSQSIKCELEEPSAEARSKLEIGSPIIVTEAPRMIKTAASVPCLRVNSGLVKPGDVGRIVSRKPKDVWAVRLTIGTYLIDGKYFKPLELDE